jgi:hypothetical protein
MHWYGSQLNYSEYLSKCPKKALALNQTPTTCLVKLDFKLIIRPIQQAIHRTFIDKSPIYLLLAFKKVMKRPGER